MIEKAIFGAGCFWGVEEAFRRLPGIQDVVVGYSGGQIENPSYKQVCMGNTGHAEVVLIEFDNQQISYDELLETFWNIHDPTTLNRQGPDIGSQYRSVIFYTNPEQKSKALNTKNSLIAKGLNIVTEISEANFFYRAEEYHQQYLFKNGLTGRCH